MTNLSAALANRQNFLIQRQAVISGNIANASTPGYLAKDVKFSKLVQAQAAAQVMTTNSKHLRGKGGVAGGSGTITESRAGMTLDGNSVVMEDEMLKLNEVQLNYRMMTQLYAKHKSFYRLALGRQQ